MTGVMQLDLNAPGDEGLLVPFGREKDAAPAETHNPLFAPQPVYRQNRVGFFRRRERKPAPKGPGPQKEEEEKVIKKQSVTFSFPTAPQAFADEEQTDDPYHDNPANDSSQKPKQPKKKEESSDEDSSSSSSE